MHTQRANAKGEQRTKRVVVLGSTGSIGKQTLEVVAHNNAEHDRGRSPERFKIVGLGAGSDFATLRGQGELLGIADLALNDTGAALDESGLRVRRGNDAARRLIEDTHPDLVVAAIVGIAGLDSVLCALELGIDVALANKESLVAGGSLVLAAARKSGACIFPVDSEHSGVWQCLLGILGTDYTPPAPINDSIRRITLTASGGPFRQWSLDDIASATPSDAINHPNWSMGAKVSIDSATLMNKGLELIEAHWLFGVDADRLDAIIHPQSIVHAFVECVDHSVIAQLGAADMRCPIQHALAFPNRNNGACQTLDLQSLSRLDFSPIDSDRFPAVGFALDAIRAGGTAGAVLNAGNEVAVRAFLDGQIDFLRIGEVVARVIDTVPTQPIQSIDDVLAADAAARECALRLTGSVIGGTR
ncbi:MAG: 1-deoxy-D-xylulose-5-phosphate reductoisomerase [Phycisphaerales bacterium]|nr:1-deoxy-D-xylulose-5-phosphate reductoisomerase [Phycisphaerales bacterium]